MPCQCGTTTTEPSAGTEVMQSGCECGSGVAPASERELKLERIVMELDQRLRRLEAAG